jgi:hypothetical protein
VYIIYRMSSAVGFPKELSNDIDYQLPASVNSYNVRVVPSNVQSVSSPSQTLTAGSTGLQLNGTSTNIIFDLPCAGGKGVHLDPRFTLVNFRVAYQVPQNGATPPVNAIITSARLRSHAMAWFDRMFITEQTGAIVEDINLFGLVNDTIVGTEIDVAQRDCLALPFGFAYEPESSNSQNITAGHALTGINGATLNGAVTVYYSYSVPLVSALLGKGASKMFNIGQTSRLQLTLQTAAVQPITFVTSTAGTAATFVSTLDNISLSCQYVDVGMEGMRLLGKTGPQYYSGLTWRVSASAVNAGQTGAVSILTGIKGSSVRTCGLRINESSALTTAGCINGIYDSKCPQASALSWNINGQLYPSNPVNPLNNPAQLFMQTQQALGNFNSYEWKSGLVPSRYFVYVPGGTLPTDADRIFSDAGNTSSVLYQSQFLWMYSLEKVSRAGIMDGMNMTSGQTYLQAQITNGSTAALTYFFLAKMDVVFILDPATGSIQVRQ